MNIYIYMNIYTYIFIFYVHEYHLLINTHIKIYLVHK